MNLSDAGRAAIEHPIHPEDSHEFQELMDCASHLGKVSASGRGTNWESMATLADTVLRTCCKHLQAAVYLAVALMRTQGLAGLVEGTGIVRDMVCLQWESMQPPVQRMRGRVNALVWWHEQAGDFVRQYVDETPHADLAKLFGNMVRDLQEALDERLGERAPILRDLQRFAEQLRGAEERNAPPLPVLQKYLEEQEAQNALAGKEGEDRKQQDNKPAALAAPLTRVPPDTPQTSWVQTRTGTLGSLPAPGTVRAQRGQGEQDEQDADGNVSATVLLDRALEQLALAAERFAGEGTWHPLRCAALCQSLWLAIARAPQADEEGITNMPAPEIAQREGIHQLQESPRADAAAALRAERALRENRFWLDAAHALVRVLEAMGETQSAQRMAGETEHLVRLYPTLLSARFADGSPMAGELSSAWLRQRLGVSQKPAPEPVSERTHAVSDSRDDLPAHLAAEKKTAGPAAGSEQLPEGTTGVPEGTDAHERLAGQGRADFCIMLDAARRAAQKGRKDIFAVVAGQLRSSLLGHDLDTWESSLAWEAWEILARGGAGDMRSEALGHMIRLRPAKALSLVEQSMS